MKPTADPIRARRPSGPTRDQTDSQAQECVQTPPTVLQPDLVRSVIARLSHAVEWANWEMCRRVLDDAERSAQDTLRDVLTPLDHQPVERLTELGGLPPSIVSGLRVVNAFARRPVTIREVVRYGEDGLRTHESFAGNRAQMVFRAIGRAQAARERRIRELLCWEIVC